LTFAPREPDSWTTTTMTTQAISLNEEFEQRRGHLRRVAYRMLGSLSEAEEAVQESWLRMSRADVDDVENLGGWMTTITARVCLNMLRARRTRREESLDAHIPDPIVCADGAESPEREALLAESVGIALLVVLDTLSPAERVAFVLHDMFAMPFTDIATIVGRTPTAARQLASRGRRRIEQAGVRDHEPDLSRQRSAVDAFFRAARGGDFDALLELLDPEVVARQDAGTQTTETSGAARVVTAAISIHNPASRLHPVIVGGTAGTLITLDGQPAALIAFCFTRGRISRIDAITDAARVRRLAPTALLGE
jgi:RNA polymerase sigma-70 factor (ECF subfamily)